MSDAREKRINELRDIISEVLEVEPEEMTDTSLFVEDHEADSLRAIEILARIEKTYKIEIPQSDLNEVVNLSAVYDVVKRQTGWED
jgi:acyl carrier protein